MSTALEIRNRQKEAGKNFFNALSQTEKWELGDDLVWGSFDWQDWGFTQKPSRCFMQGVEEARLDWESL